MPDAFSRALADLKNLVSEDLEEMERLIVTTSNSDISYITDIINHLMLSGGKRIRPIMLLAVCKMLALQDERRILIAAAIEFIHSATLLHDDVVDQSESRRGTKTSNSLWGNKASVLVGDFLLATAFQWLVSCSNFELLTTLSRASCTIVTGEIQQMVYSKSLDITREKYLEIISAKTAALFSATCESAGVLSESSFDDRKALKNFGHNFGITFQIVDDLLDYTAQHEKWGKTPGQDLSNGQVTLPMIMAYEEADYAGKEMLRGALAGRPSDVASVHSYISSLNVAQKAIAFAAEYVDASHKFLEPFPDSQYKSKLSALLRSALQRRF
ncbi:octaprenyl-diphosphate synthase [Anaplasma centrale str. Israel]|uniref:Octaprenyl-diphosphate synthase n=1 Tax=Anaplasma centrale (strain Israel) TaxID=574556 RepID=D1ATJ5_ANACI|nr:polyprenyl synthetase family protein [Anaplasma centrale]ACZ48873.1 octaprenyl-diphosphate synthase [Anaplasma centrale str. Israel]